MMVIMLALVLGSAALVLRAAATGDARYRSYQAIVERNAFGLKPIPTPPATSVKPPPLTNIILTGITTLRGVKKAYFVLPDPAKPGAPDALLYPSLKQGESFGPIQVVSIDEKNRSVSILNGGILTALTFSTKGNTPTPVSHFRLGHGGMPQPASLFPGIPRRTIPLPRTVSPPNAFNRFSANYGTR